MLALDGIAWGSGLASIAEHSGRTLDETIDELVAVGVARDVAFRAAHLLVKDGIAATDINALLDRIFAGEGMDPDEEVRCPRAGLVVTDTF